MSVDDFTVRVEFDDAITVGKIVELPLFVNNQIKGKPIKMRFKETKNKMCVLVPDKFNNYKNNTTNMYTTFMFSDVEHLGGYPLITIKAE